MSQPFHFSLHGRDLASTRRFYGQLLGCHEGRSTADWVDFDFFGNQITAHLSSAATLEAAANEVDGDNVPVRHFGAILPWDAWEAIRDRLLAAGVEFRISPRIRFAGQIGEQATMFFDDPSGNAIELKSFRDPSRIFAR